MTVEEVEALLSKNKAKEGRLILFMKNLNYCRIRQEKLLDMTYNKSKDLKEFERFV